MEHRMAERALALAGNPASVLDLPCGTGRFWSMLAEDPKRELLAADYSACHARSREKGARPGRGQGASVCCNARPSRSRLPNNSVDCIFSIRLMHHIGESANRIAMLKEFRRVSRDSVVLSLWVDGNYKAWRRRKLEQKRLQNGEKSDNRFIVPRAQFERECRECRLRDRRPPGFPATLVHVAHLCTTQENRLSCATARKAMARHCR
jgi:SAM-dependent methyltransferase